MRGRRRRRRDTAPVVVETAHAGDRRLPQRRPGRAAPACQATCSRARRTLAARAPSAEQAAGTPAGRRAAQVAESAAARIARRRPFARASTAAAPEARSLDRGQARGRPPAPSLAHTLSARRAAAGGAAATEGTITTTRGSRCTRAKVTRWAHCMRCAPRSPPACRARGVQSRRAVAEGALAHSTAREPRPCRAAQPRRRAPARGAARRGGCRATCALWSVPRAQQATAARASPASAPHRCSASRSRAAAAASWIARRRLRPVLRVASAGGARRTSTARRCWVAAGAGVCSRRGRGRRRRPRRGSDTSGLRRPHGAWKTACEMMSAACAAAAAPSRPVGRT